ncbi:PKD domain-containing protein [Methanofollis fontis]|nr:PKD domain-containing protein [Methanofollis fontis]
MYDSQIRENYITVEALVEPVADFSADVTTGKLPLTVTFIDNSIDAVSWAWDIDNDGVIDYTDQNPVHVYTDPGTYSVSLTVTSIDDVSVTILMENYITVEALVEPVADFSADVTTGKLPLTVTFIDNSIDAVSWAWDIDNDGVIDYTDQNPVHVYTDPGTYSVSLTVTSEDGLIDSLLREAYITVEQIDPPVADFEVSITTGIAPLTVQFTDCSAGSPTAWAWDFSDGATSDNQNPQHIYSDAGTFDVSLTVTNSGGSDSTTKTDYIIVTSPNSPPIADAGDSYTAPEGTAVTLDASGSSDPDGDDLQFRWDVDSDGEWETSWSANPEYSFTWEDDFSGMATVEVSDGELSATATADVSVSNEPPTFGAITAPVDPVQVDTAVSASAEWTDPGTLDTHTASWDWGDGTSSDGVVAGTEGSGTITGTHTYTVAGVYTITLKVTDDNGGAVLSVYQYVVIHDPDGGFVTGGGWIESPAGAYVADPDLTGKATFGFDSKYKKGANVPTGETEFQFQVADLNFHSDEYEWLVVAGAKAKYKGTGTISGEGSYKFMLSAVDADINKKDAFEIDRFRIKIWEKDELENEIIIYDNGLGADLEDDNALTEIGRGSIVIHTK